jgi:hypothetical protein
MAANRFSPYSTYLFFVSCPSVFVAEIKKPIGSSVEISRANRKYRCERVLDLFPGVENSSAFVMYAVADDTNLDRPPVERKRAKFSAV